MDRHKLIDALLTFANPQVLYADLPDEVRKVCKQAAEELQSPGPSNGEEESYANGYYIAIETAAQHVEAQHCVWDHTEVPIAHVIQTLANNIRALLEAPKPHKPQERPCTCHPDDNPPVPCPKKYALTECREAARLMITPLAATGDGLKP
jgi:hypothetical protein